MIFRRALFLSTLFLTSCLTRPLDVGQTDPMPVLNGVVDAGQRIAVFPGYSFEMAREEDFIFDTAAVCIVQINGVSDTLKRELYASIYSGYSPAYMSSVVALPGDEVSVRVKFSDGTIATFKETVPFLDSISLETLDTLTSPSGLESLFATFNIIPKNTSHFQLVYPIRSKWDELYKQREYTGTLTFSDFDPVNDPTNELDGIFTFELEDQYAYKIYVDLRYFGSNPMDTMWYAMFQLSARSWDYLRYTDEYLNDITLSPYSNLPAFPGNVKNAAGFILVRVPFSYPIAIIR